MGQKNTQEFLLHIININSTFLSLMKMAKEIGSQHGIRIPCPKQCFLEIMDDKMKKGQIFQDISVNFSMITKWRRELLSSLMSTNCFTEP